MGFQDKTPTYLYTQVDKDFISGKRGITNRETGELVTLDRLGEKIAAFREMVQKAIADGPKSPNPGERRFLTPPKPLRKTSQYVTETENETDGEDEIKWNGGNLPTDPTLL